MALIDSALSGYKLIKFGKNVATFSNPIGVAISATAYVKQWVDGKKNEALEQVQKAERCVQVQLIESDGQPLSYAICMVADNGGIAWSVNRHGSVFFWHPDETFRPLSYNQAWIRNDAGKATKISGARKEIKHRACLNTENCCRI